MLSLFQSQAYKNKQKRTRHFVTKVNNSTNSNNLKLQNLINITIGNNINNSKITEAKEFYKNFDEKLKKILYELEEHERSGNLIPNDESKITFFLTKTKYIYEYKDILIQILKLQKLKEITNIDEITKIILNFISLIEIYDKLIKKFSNKYKHLYTAFKKNYNKNLKKERYNGNSKKFNNNFKKNLKTQEQYNLIILTYRAIKNLFIEDILKEFAKNYYNITDYSLQTVRRLFEQYNYIKYYKIFLNLYKAYNPSYTAYKADYDKELEHLASYFNKIQAYVGQKGESISSSVTSFGQRLKSVGSEIASSALKPLEPVIASSSAIASSVASSITYPHKQLKLARKTINNAVSNELKKNLNKNNYKKIENQKINNTLNEIKNKNKYEEIIIILYNSILNDFNNMIEYIKKKPFNKNLFDTHTKIIDKYKKLLDKLLNLPIPLRFNILNINIINLIIKLIIQYIHYIVKYKNLSKNLVRRERVNVNENIISKYKNIKDFFIKNILERLAHYLIINFKYDEKLRIDLLIQIYTIFMERLKKNTNSTDEDNPEKIFDYFFKYLLNPYHFNKNNNEQTKLIKFLAVENKKMLLEKLEEIKSKSTSVPIIVEGRTFT